MKMRKFLALVFAAVAVVGCMTATAFADGDELTNQTTKQVWSSGTYTVSSGTVTLSAGVEIQGDVTLNIADGATLNIIGISATGSEGSAGGHALYISSGSLTVAGAGTLNVTGGDGSNGSNGSNGSDGGGGGSGGNGIVIGSGSIMVTDTVTLNAIGGNGGTGGDGGTGGNSEFGIGGNGGNGGNGGTGGRGIEIDSGNLIVMDFVTLNATGGKGGNGGNGGIGGNSTYDKGGSGGYGGAKNYGGSGIFVENGAVNVVGGTVSAYINTSGQAGIGAAGGTSEFYTPGSAGIDGYVALENPAIQTYSTGTLNVEGGTVIAYGVDGNVNTAVDAIRGNLKVTGGVVTVVAGPFNSFWPSAPITISGGKMLFSTISAFQILSNQKYITGGLFNIDMSDYVSDGYYCTTNIDPATKDTYGFIVLPVENYQLVSASNGLPEGKTGGVSFAVGGNDVTYAEENDVVSATAIQVKGYAATLSAKDGDNDDVTFKSNENGVATFDMPKKGVIVSATYTWIGYDLKSESSLSGEGGVTFKKGNDTVTTANTDDEISVTISAVVGYSAALSSDDVTITDGKFTMIDDEVTIKVTYTAIDYDLTSASSLLGQGGVTFKKEGNAVTTANIGDEITVVATDVDGYTVALSSDDVTITDGTFTMPAKAVSITAIYTSKTIEYFDLEEDATYADSKEIKQKYTFKQTSEEYTDVTKVKIEWTISDISATYKSHKTWDPDTLTWVEAKEDITASNQTATFKITNYSSTDVKVNVAFVVEDEVKDTYDQSNSKFDNNDCTVKTPVVQDTTSTYTEASFTEKTQTITATLVFEKDEFADLDATAQTTKYGTYTVTIVKP